MKSHTIFPRMSFSGMWMIFSTFPVMNFQRSLRSMVQRISPVFSSRNRYLSSSGSELILLTAAPVVEGFHKDRIPVLITRSGNKNLYKSYYSAHMMTFFNKIMDKGTN